MNCRWAGRDLVVICVVSSPSGSGRNVIYDGWQNFADSQNPRNAVLGYISQPSHAALASQIAAALSDSLFGKMADAVVEITGKHDVGWAEFDLAGLENASKELPASFLSVQRSG